MTQFGAQFTTRSALYAAHRPTYPDALFAALAERSVRRSLAWDCACGSGQASRGLLAYFDRVVATDASHAQLASTRWPRSISVWAASSQASGLRRHSVALVTVAQALHWLDRDAFYAECRRVLRPGGLLAAWCYGVLGVEPAIDAVVGRLYYEVLADFWPPQRALVESGYKDIAFPFVELAVPEFAMAAQWSLPQLLGYLRSWSAVVNFQTACGHDPVAAIEAELADCWVVPGAHAPYAGRSICALAAITRPLDSRFFDSPCNFARPVAGADRGAFPHAFSPAGIYAALSL